MERRIKAYSYCSTVGKAVSRFGEDSFLCGSNECINCTTIRDTIEIPITKAEVNKAVNNYLKDNETRN